MNEYIVARLAQEHIDGLTEQARRHRLTHALRRGRLRRKPDAKDR